MYAESIFQTTSMEKTSISKRKQVKNDQRLFRTFSRLIPLVIHNGLSLLKALPISSQLKRESKRLEQLDIAGEEPLCFTYLGRTQEATRWTL
jgi:hypothetical protein